MTTQFFQHMTIMVNKILFQNVFLLLLFFKGITSSTIREEKIYNPRLAKTKDEFIKYMSELKMPKPAKIDIAVPLNFNCGI